MKQIISVICLSILAGVLFGACTKPPCQCDFIPVNHLDIRIVNGQGRNLVFGPSRLFSADSIGILNINNDPKVHNASVRRSPADTAALRLNFYVPAERSFIYYNQQTITDTLDVVWTTKTGRCCGGPQTYQTIESIKLNSAPLQVQSGSYLIIK